ncbi:hypothetical protein LEN26_001523 [Aphanomyces euteiches]|nr:hypothetical protein AeMF1_005925 [Aphanomyces euteiches]KAH9161234.1 hypothetical protein LEN26_001523 [Aphanomyces euteiches]KAH9190942.1 hypothetical protein AeNC1_007084 [Aphanomyces euteiches]
MYIQPSVYWAWYSTILGVVVMSLVVVHVARKQLKRQQRMRGDMIQRMLLVNHNNTPYGRQDLEAGVPREEQWMCEICDFCNHVTKPSCVLCGTERGFSLTATLLGTSAPHSDVDSSASSSQVRRPSMRRDSVTMPQTSRLSFVDRNKAFKIRRLNARQAAARKRKEWVRKVGADGRGYWTRKQANEGEGFVARVVRSPNEDELRLTFAPTSRENAVTSFDGNEIHAQDLEILHVVAAMPFQEKYTWFVQQTQGLMKTWKDGRLKIKVHRDNVLVESFEQVLGMQKQHIYMPLRIEFIGETGLDAGGLEREWFSILTQELFDESLGLFQACHKDVGAFYIDPNSAEITKDHLLYFKATGRLLGRALLSGHLLTARPCLPLLKHILGVPISFNDIQYLDPQKYSGLRWIEENNNVECLDLYFSTTEVCQGNKTVEVDLKPNGRNILVTDENKAEYLQLTLRYLMLDRCAAQLQHLLVGLFEVVPQEMLMVFDYQELELVMCGVPDIDVEDWKANTQYSPELVSSPVLEWFWEVVSSFSSEDKARLLQFATGSSRTPIQGFKALVSYDGQICPFSLQGIPFSDTAYPRAHTCFNRIDLPLYETKEQLQDVLTVVINTEITGFTEE